MDHNIIKKFLELKGLANKSNQNPIKLEQKTVKKKMDDEYIVPDPMSAIEQIIEKKPANKYVVEYLQARVDELNEIEMNQ